MNKFEASKEFRDGFIFAVCRSSDGPRFDSELFMEGYEFGKTIKDEYYRKLNESLRKKGMKEIASFRTQSH